MPESPRTSATSPTPVLPTAVTIRRASVLTVELERLEAQFARWPARLIPKAPNLYGPALPASWRRPLEPVGLQRRAKNVGPTMSDILLAERREQETPP